MELSAIPVPEKVRCCAVSICLERPTTGSINVDGIDLTSLKGENCV